jgi:hypothetical protein
MKKLILSFFGLLCVSASTWCLAADPTIIPIGTQIQLSLLSHVTAVAERSTDGTDRMEFLDGLAQIGSYKGSYILAVDAGFLDSTAPDSNGNFKATYGIHLHAIDTFIKLANVQISPSVQTLLNDLELSPRYSFDTDVHHGVLGLTFGAVIPFN